MKRFQFGSNWESFARNALNSERVDRARKDFRSLLSGITLVDSSFLDIGFGQGLVAAMAAEGGARVTAIDIDPDCHKAYRLTREFFPELREPEIIIGSILDPGVMSTLRNKGPYDVVHSWGVLHHTGDMWRSIDNAAAMVKPGGYLVIAIYARHWTSPLWTMVKWTYVHVPPLLRRLIVSALYPLMWLRVRQLGEEHTAIRGMEFRHDLVDWIGGYPYQYASRDEIETHVRVQGFTLRHFNPTIGFTGCHEYVFQRTSA